MDNIPPYSEDYSIDLKKIAAQSDFLAVTKLLAASLQIDPYMSPGPWFKQLSDHDLAVLANVVEEGPDGEHFEELLLIAEMLAQAEGIAERNIELATERVNMLVVLLTCESLRRKGLVKVNYENVSFGDDMKDRIVVEKVDGAY